VLALWAMWVVVCAATWATNARVPLSRLYGVHDTGVVPAAGRVLVLVGWPLALAAMRLLVFAVERFLASSTDEWSRHIVVALSVLSILLA
jgi:hypothetical protein